MQRLEVSGAVRPIYGSLGVKRLTSNHISVISSPKIHHHKNRQRLAEQ